MLDAPAGRQLPSVLPAPLGSPDIPAGMSITSQCHQPAPPVGASGSCTSRAKLCVPGGAPDHASAGERFPPVQPKLSYACSSAIGAPGAVSGLVNLTRAGA